MEWIIMFGSLLVLLVITEILNRLPSQEYLDLKYSHNNQPRNILEKECGTRSCHLLGDKGQYVCNECPDEG